MIEEVNISRVWLFDQSKDKRKHMPPSCLAPPLFLSH